LFPMQIEKVYEPRRFEPHWAQWWIDSGVFHASVESSAPVFSLVIPPPNVTGSLHIGHMLEHSEIDVTIRWHRMRGENTLWLPGTDHAGIATQMVVSRKLAEEGINYRDLGREEFEKRVWQWKAESGDTIKRQMIRLGASCDWSRERFTLDAGLSRAVREVFVRLYEKGLVYRGEYMVNWCPQCKTALSDLEVAHVATAGHLWHIQYPVNGMPGRYVVVATTRPETMLGDTAVAINAKDARYADLHGRTVQLPLMDREIPIILDELADPAFGTGVVKVTPAHDMNDFEAGRRHKLPLIQVIDENAAMTPGAGPYAGLDRFEARRRVLADLEDRGLLVKTEDYALNLGTCQRCKTPVEPLVSKQWFVKIKPLADKAIDAVETGRIKFIPANWSKTYFEWMYNIRDWCISRQLWWGHRIPAWHCGNCGEVMVAREAPSACAKCGAARLTQDTDVLDTWFSSGLWPFSTLGWPDRTPDLAKFYPTSLLITGFDILFFWVARMAMMGIEFMDGEVPFREVYIHGLVRDAERQKMSKTRGNTIDPLVVTEKYGTDAVRMALLQGAAPGTDIVLTEERMASSRDFANKIWNAARFLFLNMERSGVDPWVPDSLETFRPEAEPGQEVPIEDRWIFSRLNAAAAQANRAIEQYRYHEAAQALWHFFWHEFCDWYVELKKLRFRENSGLDAGWRNMLAAFETALRLLHPAMPFLTEELWQRLKGQAPRPASIALAAYPQPRGELADAAADAEIETLQEIVTMARTLRAESKLDPKQRLSGVLYSRGPALDVARRRAEAIEKLANAGLQYKAEAAPQAPAMRSTAEFDLVLELPQAQQDAQRKRLEKDRDQLARNIANSKRQLSDDVFLGKAPPQVVDSIRSKLAGYEEQLRKIEGALAGTA
ncbi:MAG TPA: valine--tRNA ligase, partial [Bryobacteraceae bacterium]|nr:valine--tRNA ligase [Bryobacteraceae bacterium]